MAFLTALWLPIVVSAILIFIASSIIHMVLPIHKNDYQKLDNEAEFLEHARSLKLGPGQYMFPCPGSMKEMGSPEMLEKYNQGPVGYMILAPNGAPAIGKSLVCWFLYTLLVGFFVAYITWFSLSPGAEYMAVFRLSGAIAVLGYALSGFPESIWKNVSWLTTLKFVFDGTVYGLLTAGCFAWLWPA